MNISTIIDLKFDLRRGYRVPSLGAKLSARYMRCILQFIIAINCIFMACPRAEASSFGASRAEVLRLPPSLQAAASDFGTFTCPSLELAGILTGEATLGGALNLRLEGATVLDPRSLAAEWQAALGQPYSREGLGRVASRIECRYREAGYLFSKAVVKAASDGVAGNYVIAMQEGRLQHMEVQTSDPVLARLILRAFSNLKPGAPLNAGGVRRGLANAAALGVTEVRPTVRRSRLDSDGVDLIFVVASPPTEVFVQAANGGTEPLGPYGVTAGVRMFGLTPFGDRTLLGVFSSSDGREQKSVQFQSNILLNGQGSGLTAKGAYARAKPGAALAPLNVQAQTQFLSLEFTQPFIVRRGLVATAFVGLESVDQTTDILGNVRLSTDHLRVALLGARADGLSGLGVWQAQGEFRKGLEGMGASRAGERILSRAASDPQAGLFRGEASAQMVLPKGILARASLRGQWSGTALAGFEQFSFGSLNGGPGLAPGAVSGDSGLALMVALDGPSYTLTKGVTVRPTAQFSTASAWNEGARLADDTRATVAAIGVRFGLGPRTSLDLLLAEPLPGMTQVARGNSGSTIMVQVATGLSWLPGQFLKGRN